MEKTEQLSAEFIGSTILMIAAVSPIILFAEVLESHIGVALVANAIAVAWVLFALIEMFRPISGAHFNPAVTLAMLLDKKISGLKAAMYILMQVLGGILGMIMAHIMFYDEVGGLFFISQVERGDFNYFSEVIGTFILVFAILLLVKIKSSKIPIVVSLLVGGLVMSTSSTMFANPQVTIARMFTSSIVGIRFTDGLVFIVMQFLGATLAYLVYKLVFSKELE